MMNSDSQKSWMRALHELPSHQRRLIGLGVVFGAALVARVSCLVALRGEFFFEFRIGDALAYHEWAVRIYQGDWLGKEAFYQAPLYPYFLSLVYTVFGTSRTAVVIVQSVLSAIACVLLSDAARRILSDRVALIAGLIAALAPSSIFWDMLIQKSSLDFFFVCALIWSLSRLTDDSIDARWPSYGLPGLFLGCLILTRENALLLAAVVIVWILCQAAVSWKRRFARGTVFLAGVAAILLPVALRNLAVSGEFLVTTSQFGPNFYIGNNENANGMYQSLRPYRGDAKYERVDAKELAEQAVGRSLTPAEISHYWQQQAFQYIRSQPLDWIKLLGWKFVLLSNRVEIIDTEDQNTYADSATVLAAGNVVLNFGVLIPVAMLGTFAAWERRRKLYIHFALLLTYSASVILFYVFGRYRFPLLPFLAILAAAGIVHGPAWLKHKSNVRVFAAAAVIAAALFCNYPFVDIAPQRAATLSNFGAELENRNRLDEASKMYSRAINIDPTSFRAHYNLANILVIKGDFAGAVQYYRAALTISPGSLDARFNLGNALFDDKKYDEAIVCYRHVATRDPTFRPAYRGIGLCHLKKEEKREAAKMFRKLVQDDPSDDEAKKLLKMALE